VNPGYVAGWLLVSAGILLATGWKRQLTEETPIGGTLIFLAGLLWLLNLTAERPLYLYWSAAAALLAWMRLKPRLRQAYVLAAAAFVGALWIWFRKLYAVDPVFVLWHPYWDGPIAIGIVAAIAAGGFREQFVLLSGAMLLGEWTGGPTLTPWEWADAWLLALAVSRLATGTWAGIAQLSAHFRFAICRNRPK